MKIFLVYYHPEKKSFNRAMFKTACTALRKCGHDIRVSDLAAMKFDPVSGRSAYKTVKNAEYFRQQQEEMLAVERHGFAPFIEDELRKIEWCDLMIWQFPLWWFSLPAVLKGWVDRVFVSGRIYGGGHMYATGYCRGKKALLSLTTGSPVETYRNGGSNGDIIGILRPVWHGILQFSGFDVLAPQVIYAPAKMSETMRKEALAIWAERLKRIDKERPFSVRSAGISTILPADADRLPNVAVLQQWTGIQM